MIPEPLLHFTSTNRPLPASLGKWTMVVLAPLTYIDENFVFLLERAGLDAIFRPATALSDQVLAREIPAISDASDTANKLSTSASRTLRVEADPRAASCSGK